ncbi:MAG: ABATE domain-containing protein [Ilumatobacteraceae bacterium]
MDADRVLQRSFDFGGNHLALDFVNTVSGRPIYGRDDLGAPDDLFDWATAAGIVNHADRAPIDAANLAQFRAAVSLRENLYWVFGPIAGGEPPQSTALSFVTRRAAHALRSSEWTQRSSGFEPHWPQMSIEAIGSRLADEAMQLLRSPALSRVGSCAGCGWLFLDTSRAHSRRWCSMNACGVRDKMRRYHQRRSTTMSPC